MKCRESRAAAKTLGGGSFSGRSSNALRPDTMGEGAPASTELGKNSSALRWAVCALLPGARGLRGWWNLTSAVTAGSWQARAV